MQDISQEELWAKRNNQMSFEYLTEEQIDNGEHTPQYVIEVTKRCLKLENAILKAKDGSSRMTVWELFRCSDYFEEIDKALIDD